MKNQFLAVLLILCFASFKVNANEDVHPTVKALKTFVENLNLGEEESEKILSKIGTAQEACLSEADNIDPEIIRKLAEEVIPAVMVCSGSAVHVEEPHEKETEITECISNKAIGIMESTGTNDEETQKFHHALGCLERLIKR
ncbi:uncharacterized protein LOC119164991 isoform X1 [Rhipicephalus microplus]|uniref:uncharacterized protein LOC119164991 isoform X1 n=1 Tax=Rhipicephalus microplus TaxID=6941 RepID=UPI003F6AFF50